MGSEDKCAKIDGRLAIVGFGTIASSALPAILQRLEIAPDSITILCTHSDDMAIAEEAGVRVVREPLTSLNHQVVLQRFGSSRERATKAPGMFLR